MDIWIGPDERSESSADESKSSEDPSEAEHADCIVEETIQSFSGWALC